MNYEIHAKTEQRPKVTMEQKSTTNEDMQKGKIKSVKTRKRIGTNRKKDFESNESRTSPLSQHTSKVQFIFMIKFFWNNFCKIFVTKNEKICHESH